MLPKKMLTKSRSMTETGGSGVCESGGWNSDTTSARCKKESSDRVALAEMQKKKGGVK